MLSEQFDGSRDASALLYSEFALSRRLHHPNVLRPYTFEVDADHRRAFITMELMRGLTLDKLLCERPLGLPWHELQAIAAPELLDGAPLSAGADAYGVACLLYELASGKHPFRRLPSTQARDARMERELKAPRNLPRRCWAALRLALTFDPGQRRITAAQLRDALGAESSWW